MKIINSHYIPLAEPHHIIMAPDEKIAEQIGFMSVIEEMPTADGGYGIKGHQHPVVRSLGPSIQQKKNNKKDLLIKACIDKAEGDVWWNVENNDCLMVCPVNKRHIHIFQLNLLMMSHMMRTGCDYNPMGLIERFEEGGIKVEWDKSCKKDHQDIILTNMNIGKKEYLQSFIGQPLFLVYYADVIDDTYVQPIDDDDIFFEFVNQARAMLEINPHYDFHFTAIDKQMEYMTERLNKELNDYLERPDESK